MSQNMMIIINLSPIWKYFYIKSTMWNALNLGVPFMIVMYIILS